MKGAILDNNQKFKEDLEKHRYKPNGERNLCNEENTSALTLNSSKDLKIEADLCDYLHEIFYQMATQGIKIMQDEKEVIMEGEDLLFRVTFEIKER